jgi:hypothetical protein
MSSTVVALKPRDQRERRFEDAVDAGFALVALGLRLVGGAAGRRDVGGSC